MQEFNARCDPPWNERELEHKLESAAKVTRHSQPRGYLLGERGPAPSAETAAAVITAFEVNASEPLPGEARAENSERSAATVAEPLFEEELMEARRIAKELVKLYHAGAISGPDDPEAVFYAHLIHTFQGEFAGRRPRGTT